VQEEEIPLLTDVHVVSTTAGGKSMRLSADLIAGIIEQIKPQLAAEIEQSLTGKLNINLREELMDGLIRESMNIQMALSAKIEQTLAQEIDLAIKNLQQAVMQNTVNFVDKAKADLATEIPKMLHTNTSIIKADLDAEINKMQQDTIADVQAKLMQNLPLLETSLKSQLQTSVAGLEATAVENATHLLQEKMRQLHDNLLNEHQASLTQEFSAKYRELTQQTHSELNAYLATLQAQSQQQLEDKLGDTFPVLYQGLSDELGATLKRDFEGLAQNASQDFLQLLNVKLPAVEQVLANKVQEVLDAELPRVEQKIKGNIETEIGKLLGSVRLVPQISVTDTDLA
jgi:DNA polymerase III alpha subunit (gram-positive type)